MIPEVKALLLDALKSGEYEKGVGWLARENGETGTTEYCCLGVLSAVAAERGVCQPFEKFDDDGRTYLGVPEGDRGHSAYLPPSVSDWSGLDEDDQSLLARVNDNNDTFEPVIAHIETNL